MSMTWPTLSALTLVLVLLTCATRIVPSFREALADLGQREPQIDGLRGICALAVAAHHLVYVTGWRTTGLWRIAPADNVLEMMGKSAVALFFLICAYLFWGKIASAERAGLPIDFGRLLRNRVARLVPLYAAAMTLAIVVVGLGGEGFILHQGLLATLAQTLQSYAFSFLGFPVFNGSFLAYAAIGVSWSLEYEWIFYLSLPLIAVCRAPRHWAFILPLIILVNELVCHMHYIEYFAYGGLAYELTRNKATRRLLASPACQLISLAAGLVVNVSLQAGGIASGLAPMLLFICFVPVAAGATWFGLLCNSGARVAGTVSYSLYLLNITSFFFMTGVWVYAGHAPGIMLLVETGFLSAAVLISLLTYRRIERPFINQGGAAFFKNISSDLLVLKPQPTE